MIHQSKQQIKVIQDNNPTKFEKRVNEALSKLAEFNPEIIFNKNIPLCVYLLYTEETTIPENAKDELSLKGINLYCGECPLYRKPGDGRKKKGSCLLKDTPTYFEKSACEYLNKAVLKNEIIIPGIND